MSARIALIGLSGAGKSALAPLLASRLGFAPRDLDLMVERESGMPVADLIRNRGEEAFRDLEGRALARALDEAADPGVVIACGAGLLGRAENRERLRAARACVIWLQVEPETAAARIGGAGARSRPLLDGGEAKARLRELERSRRAAYGAAADLVVETEGRSLEDVILAAETAWRDRAAWDSSGS